MAAIPGSLDRVQIQKQESAALGGDAADQEDVGPIPLDVTEDAPEVAGIYFQDLLNRDKATVICRDGQDMVFTDQRTFGILGGPVTLEDLIGGFNVDVIVTDLAGNVVVNAAGNVVRTF